MADRPFQGAKESFRVSNRGTVLVVEDESAIMEMLRVGFTYEGYEVIAVQGGREALDRLQEGGVDVVVLDIMLPGVDGFEVCRRIRSRGWDVPIFMLTAKKEIGDRVKGLDLGADDYLNQAFQL